MIEPNSIKKSALALKDKLLRIGGFVNQRPYLKLFFSFAFFLSLFFYLYFSVETLTSGDDHFFHFRFAEMMRQHGFFQSFYDFKALYFSKMANGSEYFVYYNFLFYLAILPFTFINPLFLGIKLYAVFAVSFAFSILYWCLGKFGVRNSFLWVIAILGIVGTSSIFRLFLSRPYTLAPALLLLLLYFLHRKNYFGIFFVSLIYLFWHSATFYFTIGVSIIYFVFEKFYGENGDTKNLVAGIGGTGAGLGIMYALSPGFLLYIYDIILSVYKDTIIGQTVPLPEGGELYPTNFFDLLKTNEVLLSMLIVAVTIFIYRYVAFKIDVHKEVSPKEKSEQILLGSSFFLATGFFLGTVAISARFGDYFVFFGALFIALMFNNVLDSVSITNKTISRSISKGAIVVLTYLLLANSLFLQEVFSHGPSGDGLAPTGEWLDKNVPKGEVVFNTSWNWFPQLYYASPSHNYVIGLEPRFLYVYDEKLYWEWSHIGGDAFVCGEENCPAKEAEAKMVKNRSSLQKPWAIKQGEDIANTLLSDFHTSYIISSSEYPILNYVLNTSQRFEKVFTDRRALIVYHVKNI